MNDSTRSLSPSIENISIRSVFSKLLSKQPNNFSQQPIMTQNPPCKTLAIFQTSEIKRPHPRVTHHDVYHKFDCNQTTKEKTQPSFVEKSLFNKNTSLHCILLEVKTLTLIVLLSLSLFSLTKEVSTKGTGSDLSTKVWVTAHKGDAY